MPGETASQDGNGVHKFTETLLNMAVREDRRKTSQTRTNKGLPIHSITGPGNFQSEHEND
jgi:hypothetical protein